MEDIGWYEMSGTDIAYGSTMSGTDIVHACAMSSTDEAGSSCYAMSSTDLAYAATRLARALRSCQVASPISLQTSYALSGTVTAYGPICPRARYAMPGTDLAYCATIYATAVRCPWCQSATCLRACYAMSGTETLRA
eukprot:1330754-Rhodomonas_salina.3